MQNPRMLNPTSYKTFNKYGRKSYVAAFNTDPYHPHFNLLFISRAYKYSNAKEAVERARVIKKCWIHLYERSMFFKNKSRNVVELLGKSIEERDNVVLALMS